MSRDTATFEDRPFIGPEQKAPGGPLLPVAGRSIVLVGLMGAGKTTIGRKLAAALGLPFRDADVEIEQAAGRSIAEMFALWGEPEFREGERRVISRLLAAGPIVLATGGGAFMDRRTRAVIRAQAVSIWLRCPLDTLVRRVSGRTHRPLLAGGNPRAILAELMRVRDPIYAEADIVIACDDDSTEHTTDTVLAALGSYRPPRRVRVALERRAYDITIGSGLLARAGALLAPVLPQKRAMIVTDETVASLHLPALQGGLREVGIEAGTVVVPPGEGSKSLDGFERVTSALLGAGVERRTTVIALGGGVVGDLAGYAAASVMRGLPFVQIPTTLLSQVDSSVGGKTGINTPFGKNLLGAFHQPLAVLADTATLATLPARELRAGYAEILKAGLIGDTVLFDWCLTHGAAIVSGDPALQAEAIARACQFKARVVGDDEREEKPDNGRALLNLGHTFGHALEAELGYDGRLLHGEAVAIGLGLALMLSAQLGHCDASDADVVIRHFEALGMPARIASLSAQLGVAFSTRALLAHMRRDKKMRDGQLAFVLSRGTGRAFTSRDVPESAVSSLLADEGCIT
jgi:shikimate kinase / 3-dehydroquinate synthase